MPQIDSDLSLKLETHVCLRAENSKIEMPEIFTEYEFKLRNSTFSEILLTSVSPLKLHQLCFNDQLVIENEYPPLFLKGKQVSNHGLRKFGNPRGTEFLLQILEEQYESTGENGIDLHSNITVLRDEVEVFSLPSEVLTPLSTKMNVEDNGSVIHVSLKNPVKKSQGKDYPIVFDNNDESMVYKDYIQNSKVPHSYSKIETIGINLFREPFKIEPRVLSRYIGMDCKSFWKLCRKLKKNGLKETRAMSLPAMVSMYRYFKCLV